MALFYIWSSNDLYITIYSAYVIESMKASHSRSLFLATISQEGALWFQNLADVDPYGILPLGFLIPSLIGISVSQFN